jgi:hypothetical protein
VKEHGGDPPLTLAADVIGDHPDLAVLGGVAAGEKPPIAGACCFVVGGLVVCVQIAPIALGMAIKEGRDLVVGNGGGEGGGGDDAAKVVEHWSKSCRANRDKPGPSARAPAGWHQPLDALARNSWIQMRCRSWRISPATEGVESGTWKAARKAREKASRWRGDRALSCSWSWSAMAGSSRASGLAG